MAESQDDENPFVTDGGFFAQH